MLYYFYCARWGASGALYLQTALAGSNTFLGGVLGLARVWYFVMNVKVLCNTALRTVSGAEASSTKECVVCAIRSPCGSIVSDYDQVFPQQKRLHSID